MWVQLFGTVAAGDMYQQAFLARNFPHSLASRSILMLAHGRSSFCTYAELVSTPVEHCNTVVDRVNVQPELAAEAPCEVLAR